MGIISLASGKSCWRGLDYYKSKSVVKLDKINENEFPKVAINWNNGIYGNFLQSVANTHFL